MGVPSTDRDALTAAVEKALVLPGRHKGFTHIYYCQVCHNNVPDYGHRQDCEWKAIKDILDAQ